MGVCLEKQYRGKESFVFGSLVLQWWVERGGGSYEFPCSAGCVGAEFIPIITIATDKLVISQKIWYITTC